MTDKAKILADLIRQRVTEKVLAGSDYQHNISEQDEHNNQKLILEAIETAGWAPFHYPRQVDDMAEPWRVHVLWREQLQQVARFLSEQLQITSKEPLLAQGANALILVNWLPEPNSLQPSEKITTRNNEHLAASSAMVQNLLLMLTANDMTNYWSSGGRFGSEEVFDYLAISTAEQLLAAVFVEYPQAKQQEQLHKERKAGAHRDKRCNRWIREVKLT